MAENKTGQCIPQLRFPEFKNDGEWAVMKVKDICSIETGKSNTQDQVKDGSYPFFIRSEKPVRSNKYLYDCEAVITIGDGKIGQVFHYYNGKFDLHQRCYKMSDFQGVDGRYFYYYFSSHFYERAMRMSAKATVDSVRLEMIADMPIALPPTFKEQKVIASCLTSLDAYIASSKAKLEQLKAHKKGLMQKLFPAPGKTLPEYRFPEFSSNVEWKPIRLGDLFDRVTEKNDQNNENVLTISAQYGLVSQYDYYKKKVAADDLRNYYLIRQGDFAYNKSRSTGFPYGAVKSLQLYNQGVVSTLYLCFRPNNTIIDTRFFDYYFETELFNKEIGLIAQEGARHHGLLNISTEDFFNIPLIIPNRDEQNKIAESLSSICFLINSFYDTISSLEEYKKGLMLQLFPTND